jgi:F-type H+-transporting ATPase subunit epsilon
MAATFELEVATPDRLIVREQVSEASAPGRDGYLGILPEHAPLLTELAPGLLSYTVGGSKHTVFIGGGWMEVLPASVRVLAAVAEKPNEIDQKRAQTALDRAEKRLRESGEMDIARALAAAERARARLAVAVEYGR